MWACNGACHVVHKSCTYFHVSHVYTRRYVEQSQLISGQPLIFVISQEPTSLARTWYAILVYMCGCWRELQKVSHREIQDAHALMIPSRVPSPSVSQRCSRDRSIAALRYTTRTNSDFFFDTVNVFMLVRSRQVVCFLSPSFLRASWTTSLYEAPVQTVCASSILWTWRCAVTPRHAILSSFVCMDARNCLCVRPPGGLKAGYRLLRLYTNGVNL